MVGCGAIPVPGLALIVLALFASLGVNKAISTRPLSEVFVQDKSCSFGNRGLLQIGQQGLQRINNLLLYTAICIKDIL